MENTKIALFEDKKIRKIIHNDEWWFSVVDVIHSLIGSGDYLTSRKYWNKLKERLSAEGSELVTLCHQLKLEAQDGKMKII